MVSRNEYARRAKRHAGGDSAVKHEGSSPGGLETTKRKRHRGGATHPVKIMDAAKDQATTGKTDRGDYANDAAAALLAAQRAWRAPTSSRSDTRPPAAAALQLAFLFSPRRRVSGAITGHTAVLRAYTSLRDGGVVVSAAALAAVLEATMITYMLHENACTASDVLAFTRGVRGADARMDALVVARASAPRTRVARLVNAARNDFSKDQTVLAALDLISHGALVAPPALVIVHTCGGAMGMSGGGIVTFGAHLWHPVAFTAGGRVR